MGAYVVDQLLALVVARCFAWHRARLRERRFQREPSTRWDRSLPRLPVVNDGEMDTDASPQLRETPTSFNPDLPNLFWRWPVEDRFELLLTSCWHGAQVVFP
jgi:hypothetical protein